MLPNWDNYFRHFMRVLWVTNQPIAHLRKMLNLPISQSGGWMETSYASLKTSKGITLGIATIYNGSQILQECSDGNAFIAVPSKQSIGSYDPNDSYNLSQWAKVLEIFHPDIIHIWGTEYALSLCALKAHSGKIPSVVYIQGMLNQLANHYCDGIGLLDQMKYATLIDIKNNNLLWQQKNKFYKAAEREAQILNIANNVIVESDWCACNCHSIAPHCNVYHSYLPINPIFAKYNWNYKECEKHSIFTVAGGYPIKGHHMLMKAFAKVVKLYPDAKQYIPGASNLFATDLRSRLMKTTYDTYIYSIIKKHQLQDNIVLTGKLSPEQMAERISKCHVYVMPSSCENHSSSLIEAMIVGIPTISSYVGGISQYYKDGANGFFYRFNEPEVLASLIVRYFKDKELAEKIGSCGKEEERKLRFAINVNTDFIDIYETILNRHRINN